MNQGTKAAKKHKKSVNKAAEATGELVGSKITIEVQRKVVEPMQET